MIAGAANRRLPAAIFSFSSMIVFALVCVSLAHAGTLGVVSCKDPATNAPEPTEGWAGSWSATAFPYAGNVNECAKGSSLQSYVGAELEQPGSSGPAWVYTAPEGDEMIGGELSAAFAIPGGYSSPYTGAAGISAPGLQFDAAHLLAGTFSPAGGVPGKYEGVYSLHEHGGGQIWMYAFCEPVGSNCPTNGSREWFWALAEMRWADILLDSNAVPNGTAFSGPIATSNTALTGTQNLTFNAKDEGTGAPGVYLVKATLDQIDAYNATPDTNSGACQALTDHRFAGVYEFSSAHPCKASESVSIPINTMAVADGTHELVVSVIDAAGDESIVYTRQLTTNNAPIVVSEPSVSGSAKVGATLTGTPGRFQAPEGAGALSAITGQWLRCTDPAGAHCTAIPGATSTTYAPASADSGYYVLYSSAASDHDGTTTADSQPTVAVTEAANTVSGYGSQGNPAGGSGGTGGSGAGGTGGSGLGGLTINLNTPNGLLGSEAPWTITLKAKPTTVRRGQKIIFTGTVLSPTPATPRPPHGNKVYLRARTVTTRWTGKHHHHKQITYGPWSTFTTTKTNSNGQYEVKHRMKYGGTHAYQFVAIAPEESDYNNKLGVSAAVIVHEHPQ